MRFLSFSIFLFLCFFVLILSARGVSAQVIINEIAWMGTQNSANDEWIELYNRGSGSVDLNGWLLESSDGTPSISLSGSVSAGDYFLLERTDDSSVPSVSADLIYTGALGNGGEALSLKDNSGLEVHKVDAGSGWLAGDNNTKETMQWDGGAWITAAATPKALNSGVGGGGGNGGGGGGSPPPEDNQQEEPESEPQMTAQITAPSIAVAGVATEFDSLILGFNRETLTSGKYFWNFGDLTTRDDKKSQKFNHTYFYPGDYVIILDYYRNAYAREPEATDRKSIKVIPADISISSVEREAVSGEDGQGILVELSNDSTYEMDLSKWVLRSDSKSFSIPQNTIILAGKKLIFSSRITNLTEVDDDSLRLLYPGGEIAFVYSPPEPEVPPVSLIAEDEAEPAPEPTEEEPIKIVYAPEKAKTFAEVSDNPPARTTVASAPVPESTSESFLDSVPQEVLQAGVGGALPLGEGESASLYIWLLALIGLVIVSTSAVFLLKKPNAGQRTEAVGSSSSSKQGEIRSEDIKIIE